ncbi:hypothetical protein QE152_g27169 [Popillia japonica]|uniref:Uncharacterized protein n=1 Tax=Popillia japonica TaxID=7064 RepID=A0AAW1JWD3_POPJA
MKFWPEGLDVIKTNTQGLLHKIHHSRIPLALSFTNTIRLITTGMPKEYGWGIFAGEAFSQDPSKTGLVGFDFKNPWIDWTVGTGTGDPDSTNQKHGCTLHQNKIPGSTGLLVLGLGIQIQPTKSMAVLFTKTELETQTQTDRQSENLGRYYDVWTSNK